MTVVVGTAGHIDHGKTALLRALTGIDADRLPEERRRGMTIDVGYAYLRLPDGSDLDFVDVPGHDRLIANMLVGAGEIDAALLVVAADDGPRAQTLEHLALLDGLRLRQGIIALTKIDAVEPARISAVEGLIRNMLVGTSLAGSPIVAVSSTDGRGLAEVGAALVELRDRVLAGMTQPAPEAPVRLSIDRSFVIKGRGAVVTGSLRGGRLVRGASLRLVPAERQVRARELQVHGRSVDSVTGGGRVALNLAAIEVEELLRGAVLTSDPLVRASRALIALLEPIANIDSTANGMTDLVQGSIVRLHLGTDQVQATLGRGRADLVPLAGGGRVARLRLARPIAVAAGDRFVLRRGAAGGPVVGGRVLDPEAPIGPARRRNEPPVMAALASSDPLEASRARVILHGVLDLQAGPPPGSAATLPGAIELAGSLVAESIVRILEDEALAGVAERRAGPTDRTASAGSPAGISLAELRTRLVRALRRLASVDGRRAGAIVDALVGGLLVSGRLARDGDRVHPPGQVSILPPAVTAAMDRLEAALTSPMPPPLGEAIRASGCPPAGVVALESTGRIVRLDADLAYAAETYRDLALAALRMAQAAVVTPAALRDATGSSRKYVMAILEDLDRRGILRRTPAGHLPGPRAALAAQIGRIDP
jgi:selenocysteine-specific elongation factor